MVKETVALAQQSVTVTPVIRFSLRRAVCGIPWAFSL